jgi:hypothetical protein
MPAAKPADPLDRAELNRLEILVYLIPVFGFFPALWTLSCRDNHAARRNASRLAVTLALGWLGGYLGLGAGAETIDAATLPLLILASLLTSGYFLANIWLMVRLWQGKSVRLPGVSQVGDRLF